MLRAWEALSGAREGLRAQLRLAVDVDEDAPGGPVHLRSRQRVLLERPARLRVEIEGLLGTTVAVLTTDGVRYALHAADGSRESGVVHDGLLWQVAGLDLSPREAVDAILGVPPLEPPTRIGSALALEDGGVRVLVADGDGVTRRVLDFDAAGQATRLEVRRDDGAPAYSVHYAGYQDAGCGPFAHRVTIDVAGAHARLAFQDVVLNPKLSVDSFRPVDPAAAGSPEAEGG